jgi:beta-glucosidase
VRVTRSDLAYWDTRVDTWVVEGGTYAVEVGASSRDLRLRGTAEVTGDDVSVPLSVDSSVAEIMADPEAARLVRTALAVGGDAGPADVAHILEDPEMLKLLGTAPIGRIVGFPGSAVTPAELGERLRALNAERGLV